MGQKKIKITGAEKFKSPFKITMKDKQNLK